MRNTAIYHLPGLFEFYELYRRFLPLFRTHREYFYDWVRDRFHLRCPGKLPLGRGTLFLRGV